MKVDIDLLEKHFHVDVLGYENKRIQMTCRALVRMLFGRVGVIVFWFVVPSYGFGISLLARVLRCRIVIITGGYDIANMPEIGFGSMIRPRLRRLVIAMLRMATTILPFSGSASREVLQYCRPGRLVVAYPAIDVDRFSPVPGRDRENLIVTASYAIGSAYIKQKGLDIFVQAAKYVPEARFLVIGKFDDHAAEELRIGAPSNVDFTARRLTDDELTQTFQSARVYVQASAHEGFGVALAEAMAAGCVPVAANRTSMPEVVGDAGYLVSYGDVYELAGAIREALEDDGTLSRKARDRVVSKFNLMHRERVLAREVGRLLKPHRA
jgi:glycosyltransferase involved in cell wall biosynthesis